MNTQVVPFSQLTTEQIALWGEMQQTNPELVSPYFTPEFAQHVARVRDDVEVALLREGSEVVGFFPFQRTMWGVAKPVGGRLSDYHGVIAREGLDFSPTKMLRDCKLSAFEFDHLVASQKAWKPFHADLRPSPTIDVSEGFESYLENRRADNARLMTDSLKKEDRLTRQVGPLTFEWNTTEDAVLQLLFQWKSAQYNATGVTDIFSFDWTRKLIENIWKQGNSPQFSGVMCTLRAADRVVAMHFCMRSGSTLHSWFPAYDVDAAKHSPGLVLLTQMARHANQHGVHRIDLGKGDEQYKRSYANSEAMVAEGIVESHPFRSVIRKGWTTTRDLVKNSPLAGPARAPVRWLRRMREWLSMK